MTPLTTVGDSLVFTEVVDVDDVGLGQPGQCLGFAFKTLEHVVASNGMSGQVHRLAKLPCQTA